MDVLLLAAVAAFLAEWGDKTQLVVAMLATGTRKPGQVLIGLVLAALASSVAAALAGDWIADTVTIRAMTLLVALALFFAAASGVLRKSEKAPIQARIPLLSAFILCLAAEMGDRTQFLTFALAGRYDGAAFAAAGATLGIAAACIPAAALGERLISTVPLRSIRWTVSGLFLVVGFVVAISALQLT